MKEGREPMSTTGCVRGFGGLVVSLALVGVAGSAFAQDDAEGENLTDIREINVIVEELADDAEAAGLTRRMLERASGRPNTQLHPDGSGCAPTDSAL